MSYIHVAQNIPNSRKFTSCVWFRVSSKSIAAAKSAFEAYVALEDHTVDPVRPPLIGTIPLVVFGSRPTISYSSGATELVQVGVLPSGCAIDVGTGMPTTTIGGFPACTAGGPQYSSQFVIDKTAIGDPSYLGIDCTGPYPALSLNLAMPNGSLGTLTGPFNEDNQYSGDFNNYVNYPVGDPDPRGTWSWVKTLSGALTSRDRSELFRLRPYLRVREKNFGIYSSVDSVSDGPEVTPDRWHCWILSADLTGRITARGPINASPGSLSSTCKIWSALDDVNTTKKDLSHYWASSSGGPNDVATVLGYDTYQYQTFSSTTVDGPGTITINSEQASYSYSPVDIPFASGDMGLPARAEVVESIHEVEMGEFQLFLDSTMDTGVKDSRRVFINKRGRPSLMSDAADFFKKDPEVKFHGSKNWKVAHNTGSLASVTSDNQEDDLGIHVGKIESYKPDPNLYDDQGQ